MLASAVLKLPNRTDVGTFCKTCFDHRLDNEHHNAIVHHAKTSMYSVLSVQGSCMQRYTSLYMKEHVVMYCWPCCTLRMQWLPEVNA